MRIWLLRFRGVVLSGNTQDITNALKQRYGALAERSGKRGLGASDNRAADRFYTEAQRSLITNEAAGASTGCGNPVALADIKAGETVLDLGCGGGIDSFIAAKEAGPTGRVIGVDMTPRMITLARNNANKLETSNVMLKRGHIEQIPQEETTVDLVISNGVIALSEWKHMAFSEIYRVLKPGGRFVISDVVTTSLLPESVRDQTGQWVECVAGAALKSDYLSMIESAGFTDVEILEERSGPEGHEEWRSLLTSLTIRAFKRAQ